MNSFREPGLILSCFFTTCLLVTASGSDFGSRGIPTAIKAVAEEENKSPTSIQSTDKTDLEGGGVLTVSIQPQLRVGERATLDIVATAECHVRVFHFSSDEHVTELYPGTTGQSTNRPAHKKLTVSWETTKPGGLEHVLVYASKGEITNTAKGVAVGDFKVFKTSDVFSSRGIPTAIQTKEIDDTKTVTKFEEPKKAKLVHARLCYELKEH